MQSVNRDKFMSDTTAASASDINDKDIIFECPECTKSFAIDCRGAGLVIACPGCTEMVQVPDPKGLVDESAAAYEVKINQLSTSLRELTARRKYLEHLRVENMGFMKTIGENMLMMQEAIDRINAVIAEADMENT